MSLSVCTECLARLRLSSKPSILSPATASVAISQTSLFHSSAAQHASIIKKKAPPQLKGPRRSQGVRLKKKAREKITLPAVGERRALRRRIIISNTNALEVKEMEDLSAQNAVLEESSNQVLGLSGPILDQLRDCEAFKRTQNWNMFRRPATLIRSETLDVARTMEQVAPGQTAKLFLTGERQSGKSILLLQAMYLAFLKDWIVINIPEAQDFVNNTSAYGPLRSQSAEGEEQSNAEQLYIQPGLAKALLHRLAYSNEAVLKSLKLNHQHPGFLRVKPTSSISDLALIGAQEQTLAVPVWEAVWKELNTPGQDPRPPILLTVDSVDHWMGPSKYRSAEFEVIHAQQFTLVKQLTELFFSEGKTPLAHGGMMMMSTSGSNKPGFPSFGMLIEQFRARDKGVDPSSSAFPVPQPYSKTDTRVTGLFSKNAGVRFMDVNGSTVSESKALLEYFARSGLLHRGVTDHVVNQLRALSSGGVMGELARLGRRVTA
ncbi:hypothetical protein B0A52_04417 [Exophiala mesophila]|uniref:Small ribosomal subunit protein mS29 n=1 Tax=Exophiala mesophila TaxID=212818 RepID=A0A438N8W1_EXOME|nr:hypothetical protein B0A52_04417 [Exophiala mesophila]